MLLTERRQVSFVRDGVFFKITLKIFDGFGKFSRSVSMLLTERRQVSFVRDGVFFKITLELEKFGFTSFVDFNLSLSLDVAFFKTLGEFFEFTTKVGSGFFGLCTSSTFSFKFFFEFFNTGMKFLDLLAELSNETLFVLVSGGELVVFEFGLLQFFFKS